MYIYLSQQTKVYHHSCYNTHEAHNKLVKSKEKVDAARNSTQRRKKALEKEAEVSSIHIYYIIYICMYVCVYVCIYMCDMLCSVFVSTKFRDI